MPELPSSDRRTFWILAASLAVVLALLIGFQRYLVLPKIVIVGLIILAAVLTGKMKPLVRDWFVFMAFVYLFDSLRGSIYLLTCRLHLPAYALYVLKAEKAVFGGVPSVVLQNLLMHPDPSGNFGGLERVLTVCYGSHFIAFLSVGLFIWLVRPAGFSLYKTSFYILIFAGICAYALVPTTPPWMAANHFGLIPSLERFNAALFNFAIPDITSGFDTNPIAAMPSLHAAFPFLCCLLLWGLYRWKAAPFYVYTLAVLFAIVYSGDHYIMDVLAGLALAAASFAVGKRILKKARPALDGAVVAEVGGPLAGSMLKRRLLLGLGVFLIGIALGGINKSEFVLSANSYNLDVPRYVDFFRNENAYRDNYSVQLYFGNHFLARKDNQAALGYFENSLALARNPVERKEAQLRISYCRQLLSAKR
jgi:membrane-associated phospholipid phosphatase